MDLSNTMWLAIGLIGFALFLVFTVSRILSCIKKVPSNVALLVFGVGCRTKIQVPRRVRQPDGTEATVSGEQILNYRVVRGGTTLVFPGIQVSRTLDLRVSAMEIAVTEVLTKDGVPVSVDGIVQLAIGDDDSSIATAATLHLDKDMPEILRPASETLQGHLRAIVGLMSPEELFRSREMFSQRVAEVAAGDMAGLGLVIKSFVVREIKDSKGYFDALGTPQIAVVKREARIAQAQADQEATLREQTAEKNKAEFVRDTNVAKAEFDTTVSRQRAVAERAQAISLAEQDQTLEEKKAAAAEVMAKRTNMELEASVRRPADAEAYRIAKLAEAAKLKAEQDAEAVLITATKKADAIKAEGFANADVVQRTGETQAAAEKAKGMASADVQQRTLEAEAIGNQAKLLAEAVGIGAKLKAEAEGKRLLAESLNAYGPSALRQVLGLGLLNGIPAVADSFGKAIAAIKEIRLIEIGEGRGAGEGTEGALQRFMDLLPKNLFKFLQGATALIGGPIDDLVAAYVVNMAKEQGVELTPGEQEVLKAKVAAKLAEEGQTPAPGTEKPAETVPTPEFKLKASRRLTKKPT